VAPWSWSGDGPTTARLRIDERVLHHLTGVSHLDERLQGVVVPVNWHNDLAQSELEVAARVAATCTRASREGETPQVLLWGEGGLGATGVAVHACHALGLRLHRIRSGDVPVLATDRDLSPACGGEAAFRRALLIEVDERGGPEGGGRIAAVSAFADELGGLVFLASREPVGTSARPSVRFHVGRHTVAERRAMWLTALGPTGSALDGHLDAIVAQFDLGARGIRAASGDALALIAGDEAPDAAFGAALWDACRAQARNRLDDLAQRIEVGSSWDDLVLPGPQARVLREIAVHVRHRTTVYEAWGFGRKSRRGLGISALFAGPSGTGKTMAAEVLANELRLDLYRIDLSPVVSSTSARPRRTCDGVRRGRRGRLDPPVRRGGRALFGKRSEVKDSHDRYANIEVGYLLQRMSRTAASRSSRRT
jgi:hypothetical protein